MDYQIIKEIGTEICRQGGFADVLYLIISGSCEVIKNGKQIAILKELDIFFHTLLHYYTFLINFFFI